MSETPKERIDAIADELIDCGRTFEHYEHPSMRPLSDHDFIIYEAARKREARLRADLKRKLAEARAEIERLRAEVAALREDAPSAPVPWRSE